MEGDKTTLLSLHNSFVSKPHAQKAFSLSLVCEQLFQKKLLPRLNSRQRNFSFQDRDYA